VRIFVTASSGSGRGTAFAAVGPVTDLPYATAAPAVSGTDRQGDTLKASKGTWNPAGTTYAYQWQIMLNGQWANLFGATGATHLVQEAGEVDRLQVAATNSNGTTYAYSASVGPALSGQPHNTSPPAVLGIVARGHTLTAQAGSWSPSGTYAYQWQTSSDGGQTWSNIDGANYSTYTVAVGDEGHTLRVQVTGTNSYGGVSASSKASATVAASAPADKTAPAITGTAASGHALIASTGSWAGVGNTYAYQWQENAGSGFVDIDGATGSAYQVAPSDRGSTIRVVVTASNPDGQAAATSKSTPAVSS
jgi:hypothetical protein